MLEVITNALMALIKHFQSPHDVTCLCTEMAELQSLADSKARISTSGTPPVKKECESIDSAYFYGSTSDSKQEILRSSHCGEVLDVSGNNSQSISSAKKRNVVAPQPEEVPFFCHGEHESPQLAVVYCWNCSGPICDECYGGHRTLACLKKHEITSLEVVRRHGIPDPRNCVVEGLTMVNKTVQCRPWATIPLNFVVVTRDNRNSRCVQGGEDVKAVLTPTTCGVPLLGHVEDKGDGTYQLTFKCVPADKSQLTVTVNGDHVKGTPLEVIVCYPSSIISEIRDHYIKRRFGALSFTASGLLLAADNKKNEICFFDTTGNILRTVELERDVGSKECNFSGIVELQNGHIAVSISSDNCVNIYTPRGDFIKTVQYRPDEYGELEDFESYVLEYPTGVAVNRVGRLFISEYFGHRVSVYHKNGGFLYSFGSQGSGPGEFECPDRICISQNGLVYVSDIDNDRIQVFQQDGHFVQEFGEETLVTPTGLALAGNDDYIVVASENGNKLSIFSTSGECVREIRDENLQSPSSLAIDSNGFIFVIVCDKDKIVKL